MINYQYLRHLKAIHLKKREDADFTKKCVGFQAYNDSTILPLRKNKESNLLFGQGGVVDGNGKYIDSSSIALRFEGAYPFDDAIYRDETVVYCGLFVTHWGHFLVESVSRLWYFLEHDDGVSKYVFVVEENTNLKVAGNFLRFFELLGVAD